MRSLKALSALALALMPGCAFGQTAAVSGTTDELMLAKFEQLAADGVKQVRITSRGGRESIALQIAEVIREQGMRLIVDDVCTSACAQYLLVAARSVRVEPGATVSFHLNSTGLLQYEGIQQIPGERLLEVRENDRRAKALYKSRGISTKLLLDAMTSVRPYCISAKDLRIYTQSDIWVPDGKTLLGYGLRWEGYWPKSLDEALEGAKRNLDPRTGVAFGSPFPAAFLSSPVDCGSLPQQR